MPKKIKTQSACRVFGCHHSWARILYVTLIAVLVLTGSTLLHPEVSRADALGPVGYASCFVMPCGVGGRLLPSAPPPFGDADVLNFGFTCGLIVNIVGPEGANWGAYQWAAIPYDYWTGAYATNGWPYTHAGLYMLGYSIPSPNPLCPLPMLVQIGVSLFKAGI